MRGFFERHRKRLHQIVISFDIDTVNGDSKISTKFQIKTYTF